jgi:uncharacterized protein YbcI
MDTPATRTQGEVEAAVCNVVNRFHRDLTGRGPRSIVAAIHDDGVSVFLEGVLTTAEVRLVTCSASPAGGTELVRQMRDQLVRSARSALLESLRDTLGTAPTTMLHDVAPQTDEEVFVFKLPRNLDGVRRRA